MWSSWPCVSTIAWTSSSRSSMYSKSGRIRSTPGWWSSGKSTPQSMIEQLAGVLDDGHVAADLAEAAERRRRARRRRRSGGGAGRARGGGGSSGSAASRGRSGAARGAPVVTRRAAGAPAARLDDAELDERGLGHDRALRGGHDARRRRGPARRWMRRAAARSPRSTAATIAAYCSPATWPTTDTTPVRALREVRRG